MALSENPTLEEIIDEIDRLNNLIVDRGGERIITPTTTNQILAKGNYKGDITVLGDANLKPENILSGKSIFGVNGNVVAGKRWASGSVSPNGKIVEVRNIGFEPKLVHVYGDYNIDTQWSFVYISTYGSSRLTGLNRATSYTSHPDYNVYGDDPVGFIRDDGFYCETSWNHRGLLYWVAYE